MEIEVKNTYKFSLKVIISKLSKLTLLVNYDLFQDPKE